MSVVVEDLPDIGQVLEDNVLALLDTVGVKNADDIQDDKMSFIEAVYALCIGGTQPKAPTWSVHKSVFHLLDGNHSLVLNVASYSLLIQIAEQYPHILIRENNRIDAKREVVLNNKIWSPFRANVGVEEKAKVGVATRQANQGQQYCEDFVSLLQELQEAFGKKPWAQSTEMGLIETKCLSYKVTGHILKFKYLFFIVEHDFKCRFQVNKGIKSKETMSDCYLVHLFQGSKAKQMLELLFDLIASSSTLWKCRDEFLDLRELSLSLQALIEMRLSLELERNIMSSTSTKKMRGDASRNFTFMELFTTTCQFNKELLKTLLLVMEDSDCKLRIIFANFLKDIPKPLAAEKVSDPENMTTQQLVNCLGDANSARSVYKVSDSNVLQVFLASAFKADLRLTKLYKIDKATLDLCKSLKCAFRNLQSISNEFDALHPAAKQALITAEMMIALANYEMDLMVT